MYTDRFVVKVQLVKKPALNMVNGLMAPQTWLLRVKANTGDLN